MAEEGERGGAEGEEDGRGQRGMRDARGYIKHKHIMIKS